MSDVQLTALAGMALAIAAAVAFFVIGRMDGRAASRHDAAIMDAGYRAALLEAVAALELWERTRGGWSYDGTTTTPAATAMSMARALGYGRTALLANSKTPNVAGNRLAEGKSELTGLLGGPTRSEKE